MNNKLYTCFIWHNWTILIFGLYLHFQIVFVNVSMKEKVPKSLDSVVAPHEVAFTYSVNWQSSEFSDQFNIDLLLIGTPKNEYSLWCFLLCFIYL